jgi:hypothetical protein
MDEEHFYKNDKNSIDGYSSRCKECEKERAVQWRKDNRERWLEIRKNRNQKLEVKLQMRKDAKKSREKGVQKQWQQNNPERVKEHARNHRKHDISINEWKSCIKAFNNQCAYCGISYDEQYKIHKQNFHKDHKDHDGYNDVRNCVPACRSCNDKKWQFEFDEWYNSKNPVFSQERYDKIIWWTTEGYKVYIENKPPYILSRSRINNLDGTWHYMHELWTVDEKRNMIKCIYKANKKKEIIEYINTINK